MFALRVRINDEEPVTGGAEDLSVISAGVTGVGLLGPASIPSRPDEGQEFFISLGGLSPETPDSEREHLYWIKLRYLKVGDKVTIEIIETDTASPVQEVIRRKPNLNNRATETQET
jgi:hypothetical protein